MTRPLVVYGAYINGKNRIVVAASTKKSAWEAMKAAGWIGGYHFWTRYACPTKNAVEVAAALKTPCVAVVIPA